MPSDLTPVLRKVHGAWAKLKAARRAKVRADSAKSDAAGKYEQKVREMAEAAVSGVTQFQKARIRRPDQRSDGQEGQGRQ